MFIISYNSYRTENSKEDIACDFELTTNVSRTSNAHIAISWIPHTRYARVDDYAFRDFPDPGETKISHLIYCRRNDGLENLDRLTLFGRRTPRKITKYWA